MSGDFQLDPIEQRVLGALLEKQVTVPGSYPLTLKALGSACNQASSREPVTDYGDQTLLTSLRGLKERDLIRTVWAGKGSRTVKYHQLLTEQLDLDKAERALLTVLLLRGAQAPGELKIRTERLHPFADRAAVESCLTRLAERELVRELERLAGQHDRRWVHVLGEVQVPAGPALGEPEIDREIVLAQGAKARDDRVRAAWDANAQAYADQYRDELDDKPFERWLLDEIVDLVGEAPVLEVGCGPGQIAGYLAEAGADVTGVDLSPRMIEIAREHAPAATFMLGNQLSLLRPPSAHGWGAIVSFYSTVHLAASELGPLLAEFGRVLDDDGRLLLAVWAGHEVREHEAGATVVLHDPAQVLAAVHAAGFVDVRWYMRGPLAGEVPGERFFVTARSPGLG